MSFKKDIVGLHENETLWGVLKANGFLTNLVITLSVCLALFHLVTSYSGQLEAFRHRTVHLMMVLIVLFLVVIIFGAGLRCFRLQECLTVGDGDLVVIGMNLAEGEKTVTVPAIFHESRLKRWLHPRHAGRAPHA